MPNMPAGAVPPKKETGKVQPKKETVRITLPPKPSAAPTIKLPTLPPGGPGAAASKPGAAPAPAPRPQATATQAAAPRAAAPGATSAPRSATAPARTAPAGAAAQMTHTDAILCIAAAVVGLIAVGSTVYLGFIM
jgi:outer membrane biosynthesis protein TonB